MSISNAGDIQPLTIGAAARVLPRAIQLPTDAERQAWQLRQKNLSDRTIGKLLAENGKPVPRETINRRINRFERKRAAITSICGGDACVLLRALAG